VLSDHSFHTGIALSLLSDPYRSLGQFTTASRNVRVHDRDFTILAVEDVNALLDAITPEEFARDERLPYWAELWPSSIALGGFCLQTFDHDVDVLEIGCGLGLAGLCAALAGARVHMTDYDGDALTFARYNCEQNLPREVFERRVTFQQLDWRHERPSRQFDIVMGSDVLYERSQFDPIVDLTMHTVRTGGSALFTDPCRSTRYDFIACAERNGFRLSIHDSPAVNGVSLLHLRLPAPP
jgi:predicted nicotinamide N-methyase